MGKPLYPHGFVTAHDPSTSSTPVDIYERFDGDKTIERLFYEAVEARVNHHAWRYRREVIDQAVRLFGPFDHWLKLQQFSPYLYGRNFDFLTDTMRYLQTGRREISVNNWFDLMQRKPERREVGRRTVVGQGTLSSKTATQDVIAQWCSYPGGFEDMLYSLYLFFGVIRTQ